MKPTSAQDATARNYLERSRQSARECRVRKTIRFQYLELLVERREKDVVALKEEMDNVSYDFSFIKPATFSSALSIALALSYALFLIFYLCLQKRGGSRILLKTFTVDSQFVSCFTASLSRLFSFLVSIILL